MRLRSSSLAASFLTKTPSVLPWKCYSFLKPFFPIHLHTSNSSLPSRVCNHNNVSPTGRACRRNRGLCSRMEDWQPKHQALRTRPIASLPLRALLDYGSGELPFQKCKVALDSVIFSEKASSEKLASNFADIVTQMAQDHTMLGEFRSCLIKLAR